MCGGLAGRNEEYTMKLKAIAVNLMRSAVILGIAALGLPFCDGDGTYFIFMLFICTAMVIGADYDDSGK